MTTRYFIKKWSESKDREAQYQLLRNVIKRLYRNSELIGFMEGLLQFMGSKSEQQLLLHWYKRILLSTNRQPDEEHFEAFKEAYLLEFNEMEDSQTKHDPILWVDHELQCLEIDLAELLFNPSATQPEIYPSFNQNVIPQDIYTMEKELLTSNELMGLLGISKTTLDRRKVDGLKFIKDGRKVYFKKKEVIRYLESKRF